MKTILGAYRGNAAKVAQSWMLFSLVFLFGCSGAEWLSDPDKGDSEKSLGRVVITSVEENPIRFDLSKVDGWEFPDTPPLVRKVTLQANCEMTEGESPDECENYEYIWTIDFEGTYYYTRISKEWVIKWEFEKEEEAPNKKTIAIFLFPDELMYWLREIRKPVSDDPDLWWSYVLPFYTSGMVIARGSPKPGLIEEANWYIFTIQVDQPHPATYRYEQIPSGAKLEANPYSIKWKTGSTFAPLTQKIWISNVGSEGTTLENITLVGDDSGLFALDSLPVFPKEAATSLGFPFSIQQVKEAPNDQQWYEAQIVATQNNGPLLIISVRTMKDFD